MTASAVGDASPGGHAGSSALRGGILLPGLIVAAYGALVLYGVSIHEPWFDEAQAWLLVRDSSLWELLSVRLRYEGHPPLWYLLVYPLARLGAPFESVGLVSAAAGVLGTAVLAFDRRVPLAFRALVPFTYFFAYQFAVVARSYALFFPLLALLARLWPAPLERPRSTGTLLGLLCLVSAHGACMAWALACYAACAEARARGVDSLRRRGVVAGLLVVSAFSVVAVLTIRPPGNLAIQPRLDLYQHFFWERLPLTAARVFLAVGETPILGIVLTAGILLWLLARRRLLLALTLLASVLPLLTIYMSVWHEGLLVLVLFFAVLVALRDDRRRKGESWALAARLAGVFLVMTAVLQVFWTGMAMAWDRSNTYSGARAAAAFVQRFVDEGKRIVVMGFSGLGLGAYLGRNIYSNYSIPGGGGYWHWGAPSPLFYAPAHVLDPRAMARWAATQLTPRPDVIVVSAKFRSERIYGQVIEDTGDYCTAAIFPGGIFWKTRTMESETFFVFVRKPPSGCGSLGPGRRGEPAVSAGSRANAASGSGRRRTPAGPPA